MAKEIARASGSATAEKTTSKVFAPVPKEMYRWVKIQAVQRDVHLQDIVLEALTEYRSRRDARK
jgi:hypothetical protein